MIKFKRLRILHILSYFPLIGIIWASDKQMHNKLYILEHWFISVIFYSIAFIVLLTDLRSLFKI